MGQGIQAGKIVVWREPPRSGAWSSGNQPPVEVLFQKSARDQRFDGVPHCSFVSLCKLGQCGCAEEVSILMGIKNLPGAIQTPWKDLAKDLLEIHLSFLFGKFWVWF